MTGHLDRDWFDAVQDMRAEHAGETGEPMTLAEAMYRLVNWDGWITPDRKEQPCETLTL